MKNKREIGITLIALVITIIVLLILAGITISQLTGSGLFENSKLAKEKSEEAQKLENSILGEYENQINTLGTRQDNKNYIIKLDYAKAKQLTATSTNTYNINEDGYLFTYFNSATDKLEMNFRINNVTLGYGYATGNYEGINFSAPVTKGDVFTITNSKTLNTDVVYLVPYKN